MLLRPVIYTLIAPAASIAMTLSSDSGPAAPLFVRHMKREVKPLSIQLFNSTEVSFARPDSGWPQGTLSSDAFVKRVVDGKEQKYVSAEGAYTLEGLSGLTKPMSVNFTTWIYDSKGSVYRGKFVNQCMLWSAQGGEQSSETMVIGPYSPPLKGTYGPVQMNCTNGHPWKVPEDDGPYGYILVMSPNLTMRFTEPPFYDGRPLVANVDAQADDYAYGLFKGLDKAGRDGFKLHLEHQQENASYAYNCGLSIKNGSKQSLTTHWGFWLNATDGTIGWDKEIRSGVQAECELKNSTSTSV